MCPASVHSSRLRCFHRAALSALLRQSKRRVWSSEGRLSGPKSVSDPRSKLPHGAFAHGQCDCRDQRTYSARKTGSVIVIKTSLDEAVASGPRFDMVSSRRVRPWLSRASKATDLFTILLPSCSTCVVSGTAVAVNRPRLRVSIRLLLVHRRARLRFFSGVHSEGHGRNLSILRDHHLILPDNLAAFF